MVFLAACTWAQDLTLSGSVQSDMLLPQSDERTGAQKTEDFMTNTYADLLLQRMPASVWSIWNIRCQASRTTSRAGASPTSG